MRESCNAMSNSQLCRIAVSVTSHRSKRTNDSQLLFLSWPNNSRRTLVLHLMVCVVALAPRVVGSPACIRLRNNEQMSVVCNGVQRLPPPADQIQPDVTQLVISAGRFGDGETAVLAAANFSGLEALTYLKIENSDIKRIEPGAFHRLRSLRILDLTRNSLAELAVGAFSDLRLDRLTLSANRGLRLPRGTFRGARLHSLVVKDCELDELAFATVEEAGIRELMLSGNRIQRLDSRFASLIRPLRPHPPLSSSLSEVVAAAATVATAGDDGDWGHLDLSDNPLDCTCDLYWLAELVEEQLIAHQRRTNLAIKSAAVTGQREETGERETRGIAGVGDSSNGGRRRLGLYELSFTCNSPPELRGHRLPRTRDLLCPPPRIVGVDVRLWQTATSTAELTCIARGQTAPNLAWTYRLHNQQVQRILKGRPSLQSSTPKLKTDDGDAADAVAEAMRRRGDNAEIGLGAVAAPWTSATETRLALNVSLAVSRAREFICTAWNEATSLPSVAATAAATTGADTTRSNGQDTAATAAVPQSTTTTTTSDDSVDARGLFPVKSDVQPRRVHQVSFRIRGAELSPTYSPPLRDMVTLPTSVTGGSPDAATDAVNVGTGAGAAVLGGSEERSHVPYASLYMKRFSLVDLIIAVISTVAATLGGLYAICRLLPLCCSLRGTRGVNGGGGHGLGRRLTGGGGGKSSQAMKHLLLSPPHSSSSVGAVTVGGGCSVLPSDGDIVAGAAFHTATAEQQHRLLSAAVAAVAATTGVVDKTLSNGIVVGASADTLQHLHAQKQHILLPNIPSTVYPSTSQASLVNGLAMMAAASVANGAPYWTPAPDYIYSASGSHEYDVPRLFDPLAAAAIATASPLLMSTHNSVCASTQASLLRRQQQSIQQPPAQSTSIDTTMSTSNSNFISPAGINIPLLWEASQMGQLPPLPPPPPPPPPPLPTTTALTVLSPTSEAGHFVNGSGGPGGNRFAYSPADPLSVNVVHAAAYLQTQPRSQQQAFLDLLAGGNPPGPAVNTVGGNNGVSPDSIPPSAAATSHSLRRQCGPSTSGAGSGHSPVQPPPPPPFPPASQQHHASSIQATALLNGVVSGNNQASDTLTPLQHLHHHHHHHQQQQQKQHNGQSSGEADSSVGWRVVTNSSTSSASMLGGIS